MPDETPWLEDFLPLMRCPDTHQPLRRATEEECALNKVEAAHRSVFVAGWRPFIGWVCGLALGYVWLLRPIIMDVASVYGIEPHFTELPLEHMLDLVLALLGLSGLRTYEKLQGRAR